MLLTLRLRARSPTPVRRSLPRLGERPYTHLRKSGRAGARRLAGSAGRPGPASLACHAVCAPAPACACSPGCQHGPQRPARPAPPHSLRGAIYLRVSGRTRRDAAGLRPRLQRSVCARHLLQLPLEAVGDLRRRAGCGRKGAAGRARLLSKAASPGPAHRCGFALLPARSAAGVGAAAALDMSGAMRRLISSQDYRKHISDRAGDDAETRQRPARASTHAHTRAWTHTEPTATISMHTMTGWPAGHLANWLLAG